MGYHGDQLSKAQSIAMRAMAQTGIAREALEKITRATDLELARELAVEALLLTEGDPLEESDCPR